MGSLSISAAWDESKAVLARDGRLFASVALALIVLPAAIVGAFYPGGLGSAIFAVLESNNLALMLLVTVVFLVILTGQLAVTRLAIGPSITVGGAISHSVRRLPSYVAVALIMGAAIMIVMLIGALLIATTVKTPVSEEELAKSPAVAIVVFLMLAAYLFLMTRVVSVAAAVATTEGAGPLRIIRRAWALTAGHFWRLFGFLVVFMIGTGIAIFAIISVVGFVVPLVLGSLDPMSASALVLALVAAIANGAVILVFAVMLARIYVQLARTGEAQASVPSSGI
jgi:hypothetical protein